jgi:hypothetical protein
MINEDKNDNIVNLKYIDHNIKCNIKENLSNIINKSFYSCGYISSSARLIMYKKNLDIILEIEVKNLLPKLKKDLNETICLSSVIILKSDISENNNTDEISRTRVFTFSNPTNSLFNVANISSIPVWR